MTKVLPDGSDYRQTNPLGYLPYLVLDSGTVIHKNFGPLFDPGMPAEAKDRSRPGWPLA